MSCIHYKFKSSLDYDTLTFDGLHISLGDLKKAIIQHKRLGKMTDFDLQVTNAQTKEEYTDNESLIPKNASVIVARIPLGRHKGWASLKQEGPGTIIKGVCNIQHFQNLNLSVVSIKGCTLSG